MTAINLYCVTDSKQFRLGFFTVLHNYKIMPYIDEYMCTRSGGQAVVAAAVADGAPTHRTARLIRKLEKRTQLRWIAIDNMSCSFFK